MRTRGKVLEVALGLLIAGEFDVGAQGLIDFRNRITGTLDVPFYSVDGTTLLSGANFLAQLFYATSPTSLTPITDPAAPFRTGAGAGYWNAGADSTRVLPGITAGSIVFLQVRVWESVWMTYDGAKAGGGFWGDSNVFTVAAGGTPPGGPPLTPAPLIGLESFALIPEPSTIALGILGAAAVLLRRRMT
jgi:hypothetical protein